MVYRFTTGFPETLNQSGLKNLLCSGYPIVTLMALDLVRLRTVRSMGDEYVYRGAHYDPLRMVCFRDTMKIYGVWICMLCLVNVCI